ncbi:MAG: FecR domain-containing protein [Verrucomicrobiota bacterium]
MKENDHTLSCPLIILGLIKHSLTLAIVLSSMILFFSHKLFAQSSQLTSAEITFLKNDVAKANVADLEKRNPAKEEASKGDVVNREEAVLTGTKSKAELFFNDGTVTRLGSHAAFTFKPQSREITMQRGSALFNIPKGRGTTTIRAAGVTAAITGTTVVVQIDPSGNVAIFIYEGTCTIGSVKLNQGEVFIVGSDGAGGKVEEFDVERGLSTIGLIREFIGSSYQDRILREIKVALNTNNPNINPENRNVIEDIISPQQPIVAEGPPQNNTPPPPPPAIEVPDTITPDIDINGR